MVKRILGPGFGLAVITLLCARSVWSDGPTKGDPATWGSDHVGKPVPRYVTGDECLFCHRKRVSQTWGVNPHNRTIHRPDESSAAVLALKKSDHKKLVDEIDLILGSGDRQRFLHKSKAYGKFDLHSLAASVSADGKSAKLLMTNNPHWDAKRFGASCAGYHTTGVDSTKQTFSAWSLDCYACHGDVDLNHSKKPELVYLAKKRKDPARVVISICAQCHVRSGKSKSSGRPYPNNFVAGDNLFRDFQVDFSDEKLKALSTADRHVMENVRDVVIHGKDDVTCLSCHDVHSASSRKHHFVKKSDYCLNCHHAEGPRRKTKPITAYNRTCEYQKEVRDDGK